MIRRGVFPTLLLLVAAIGGFGVLLWVNAEPTEQLHVIVPTQVVPTVDPVNPWQSILRAGFGSNSTPLPTIAIPTEMFMPPTIPPTEALTGDTNIIPIAPGDIGFSAEATVTPFSVVTPTRPAPIPTFLATDLPVTVQVVTRAPAEWQPPPLIPPLSRDSLGRDHYWFIRPVDSNATNFGLFYYPFGSDGPEDENPWRVHNAIDMPNPVGETVRAAGSGTVVWAADGLRVDDGVFQNTLSYGNVIVIQHDFGYRGQPIFTLYAHLSAALVQRGQVVSAGDVIGLVGATGRVSGPHVHFEVRMGENSGANTYNPVLWMVPYVGHGVIAGRVIGPNGDLVQDADVTVNSYATGLVAKTTSTYVDHETGFDVNPDPIWQENFVVPDVPAGRYEVVVSIDGQRVSRVIDVVEGTTTFVELAPRQAATAQAVTEQPTVAPSPTLDLTPTPLEG